MTETFANTRSYFTVTRNKSSVFRRWIFRDNKSSAHGAKMATQQNPSILYFKQITYILPKGSGLVTK